MMRFEYPWALLLLLLIPALMVWRWRRPDTQPAAVLWGTLKGLPAPGPWGALVLFVRTLPWVALVFATIALARPQQGVEQSEVDSKGVDIVLAMLDM